MSAIPLPLRRRRGDDRPRLRLVPPPKRRHTFAFALLIVALSGVVVFTTVAVNALAAGDAVRARELEGDVASAEQRYGQLVAEVARLEDPARIEQVARADLGMVDPAGARFVVVERPLPGDGVPVTHAVSAGEEPDPLKPVLSVER